MPGIYVHIPFCSQKCNYCSFYSVVSFQKEKDVVEAICNELIQQKDRWQGISFQTLYFGGGTPSLLSEESFHKIFDAIHNHYDVSGLQECTLEANPNDLTVEKLLQLKRIGINRLSIGIQSFHDDELRFLNRSHNMLLATTSVCRAQDMGFDNISIDLMFGIPEGGDSLQRWRQTIDKAILLNVPHISCYALTAEPKTVFFHNIDQGKVIPASDEQFLQQYQLIVQALSHNGYEHYEISNFSKPNAYSLHNRSYWFGEPYLGVGPSAHSYDGVYRWWNFSRISSYVKGVADGDSIEERERLTETQKYNEYVMTRLRTQWGVSIDEMNRKFHARYVRYFIRKLKEMNRSNFVDISVDTIKLSQEGMLVSDAIFVDLFYDDDI